MKAKTALVVGGTGPTGPYIVNGLRERGYTVAILHRGNHEIDEIPADVEHIHIDPHFLETLTPALAGREFDLCIATYGRIRFISEVMAGKTGRFISAGGMTYRAAADPALVFPRGGASPFYESDPQPTEEQSRFFYMIGETERHVLAQHPNATILRYPYVYGAYQVAPREWSIIRRILDGRKALLLPDGGMGLLMHGYAANVAAAVLAAVDNPERSAGQAYNCGDERQFTLAQLVEIIADEMDVEVETVAIPSHLPGPGRLLLRYNRSEHLLTDIQKIRVDLDYKDVVDPEHAIRETTRWYLNNRPEPGGHIERTIADPFNYDLEDRLIHILQESEARLRAEGLDDVQRHHAYAHPKRPGEVDHRGR